MAAGVSESTKTAKTTLFGANRVHPHRQRGLHAGGVTIQAGELGNTWNIVPLADGTVGLEILPRQRTRHAVAGRLAQWLPWNGAIRGYYRVHWDDWGIAAHSLDIELRQRLLPWISLSAEYRWHTQTAANFFTTNAPAGSQALRTADSDLDRFRSQMLGVGARWDLRGHTIVAGRVSLVNLWASWCDACVEEQRALNQLSARVNPNDAVVIGIAVGESRRGVDEFLRHHPSNYVQFVDEDFKFADTVGGKRVPTTMVVDYAGRIVFAGGAVDAHSLQAFRRAISDATSRPAALDP